MRGEKKRENVSDVKMKLTEKMKQKEEVKKMKK